DVGHAVTVAVVAATPTQQDAAQTTAHKTIHVAKCPTNTVLEVPKPADQRRIHIRDDRTQADARVPPRLRPQAVLELLHALRPRPTRKTTPPRRRKVVAEKIKARLT